MKKRAAFLLCLIMTLSLFSCDLYKNADSLPTNGGSTDLTDGSTDSITSPPSEAEIAMEMYEAAINDEICVIDESLGEIKLKDCLLPGDNVKLAECKFLNKAIPDMDGDGINEFIIQSEAKDHIVLRYYMGKVYSYCFDGSSLYNLNTDGSFYWLNTDSASDWKDLYSSGKLVHGLSQIEFDGSSLSIKEIYVTKQAGSDIESYEFFVDGKQITEEEFGDYYRSNHRNKTSVSFSPLDISCDYPISSEKAFELASKYWEMNSGMTEGAAGTLILHRLVILEKPDGDTPSYRIRWQMEAYHTHVPDDWYSLPPHSVRPYKEIYVDATTGECFGENTNPEYDSES